MDFKKIAIIATLAIIATGLAVSCSLDDDGENNTSTSSSTPTTTQATTQQIEHDDDSFENAFWGSFLGSWIGNNMNNNNNYPSSYDNYERRIPTTIPSNNSSTSSDINVKDIEPPKQTERSKQNISPDKRITTNQSVTGKTGIGNGGTRGSVSKSAAS